jgi:hypothetical protein
MRARTRTLRATIVAVVVGVAVLVLAGVAAASTLYCGSGRGPTPEYAIKKAIYDAGVSATTREVIPRITSRRAGRARSARIMRRAATCSAWLSRRRGLERAGETLARGAH